MWNSFKLFAIVVSFTLLSVANAFAEGKKYAVLVGIKKYDHSKLDPLDYTENDVAELADLLKPAGYDVTLLTDATGAKDKALEPTKANIDKALKTVLDKCKRDDLVLIAFAGHGLQFEGKTEAYFCPKDARPLPERTDSLISLDTMYKELNDSGAGVKLLLVDACRNDPQGGRGRGVDADAAKPPPKGVFAFFSCSGGERAFEHKDLKHGVFFHFVLEGLKGKARDEDGEVTIERLALYVRKQVPLKLPELLKGAKQSPVLRVLDATGASPVIIPAEDLGATIAAVRKGLSLFQEPRIYLGDLAAKRLDAWRVAATNGVPDAQFLYAHCLAAGLSVAKSEVEAVAWYRKAADKGQLDAMKELGWCYHAGLGVETNAGEAYRWYRKAADKGHLQAIANVGTCHELGVGVNVNHQEAAVWYRKAADKGHAVAQLRLGFLYAGGKGVEKDAAKAANWYRLSAEQGNALACHYLALCYERGDGIEKSEPLAIEWYRKAAAKGNQLAKDALKRLGKEP